MSVELMMSTIVHHGGIPPTSTGAPNILSHLHQFTTAQPHSPDVLLALLARNKELEGMLKLNF